MCSKEIDDSVAGVDEAGRGPWAGPVVAAAAILSDESGAILRAAGCRIALDAAGISGDTHNLIGALGASIIKLDESLMHDLPDNPLQAIMVEAIHRMALMCDAATVARLAETARELDRQAESGTEIRVLYLEHADAELLLPVLQVEC